MLILLQATKILTNKTKQTEDNNIKAISLTKSNKSTKHSSYKSKSSH